VPAPTGGTYASLSTDGALAFISNPVGQGISVVQVSTQRITRFISLSGHNPQWVVSSPDSSKIYVVANDGPSLGLILSVNVSSGQILSAYTAPNPLGPAAISPDGSRLYVNLLPTSGNLQYGLGIVATSNMTLMTLLGGIYNGSGVAVSPDGASIYVPNQGVPPNIAPQLSIIDSTALNVTATVPLTAGVIPGEITMNAQGSRAYIVENGSPTSNLAVIDLNAKSYLTKLNVPNWKPVKAAPSADGLKLYVTDSSASSVRYFDGNTYKFLGSIYLPGSLNGIVISPDNSTLFVPNSGSARVVVVDQQNGAVQAIVPSGDLKSSAPNLAGSVVVNPTGYVFATNFASNNLTAIDPNSRLVVGYIPVGLNPIAAVISKDSSRLYVLNAGSRTVSIINPKTFATTATIALPPSAGTPTSITLSPDNSRVYISTVGSTTDKTRHVILVINASTNSFVAPFAVGPTVGLTSSADGKTLLTVTAGTSSQETMAPVTVSTGKINPAGIVNVNTPTITTPQSQGIVAGAGGTIYMTAANSLFSVNPTALTSSTLFTGGAPGTLALTPDGQQLWMTNYASPFLTIFNATNGAQIFSSNISNNTYGIAFK
jgi:YVTN family beta-propeller protein